jgi:hypothetical protein
VITWIDDACAATARQSKACEAVGIFGRTLQRWREKGGAKADGRKQAGTRSVPANKLSEYERQQILDVANAPKFAHLPPSQIVPSMALTKVCISPRKRAFIGFYARQISWPTAAK